jgi:hypothetical protein
MFDLSSTLGLTPNVKWAIGLANNISVNFYCTKTKFET